MRLSVLGSSASYADAGRACAGYLLQDEGTRVMLDCGHGALANLARLADPLTLDAVFITHLHPDHVVDLFALQARLRYAPEGAADPLKLVGPGDLLSRMACLLGASGRSELEAAFDICDLRSGEEMLVGGLRASAHRVEHSDESYALVIDGKGGRLCYTGDARATNSLVEVARDADVLLCEATLPEEYEGAAPHMTAGEAARIAYRAGVGTLVLTHMWPTVDREAMLERARGLFKGEVLAAEEFMEIEIGRGPVGNGG